MPLTPDEAAKENLRRLSSELESLYSEIDAGLRKNFFGDNVVTISLGDISDNLMKIIKENYEKHGWVVRTESGHQYNERWTAIKFQRA
jgi:hypothetical protein